jgi:Domain of unknown function (DUF4190)
MSSDGDTYGDPPFGQPGGYGHAGPSDQPGAGYGQPGGYSQPGPYGQPGAYQAGPYGPYTRVGRRTNPLAIASLCLGIGQVIAWILAGIPAIVLGFMALNQIRRTGEDGRGMAITGIVLGFVGIIGMALFIIFFIAIFHAAQSNAT